MWCVTGGVDNVTGLGYHNKGRTTPYVYAGTDAYRGGKYVADGRYNSRVYDQQPGVVAMVQVKV